MAFRSTSSMPVLPGKVLFVTHEASRTGAPMFLLHFLRWLKRETRQPFEILVRRDGPLAADFAAVGRVLTPALFEQDPTRFQQYALIYSNTACNGLFLGQFALGAVPVVTHVHELDCGIDSIGARSFAEIIRHTGHFVACAQAVASQLRRRFAVPSERISVHYEMFDPAQTDANARQEPVADVRRTHQIPPDALVVAACGTVDARKGADLFVQLAASVLRRWREPRPLRFVWIGKAQDRVFFQMLRHDLRRLRLEGQVLFSGEQANPHALLSQADVFCLTSREDPFPLVMLESTALGKPLLAFDGSGGAAELCAQGAGLTVPLLDVEAMAGRCLDLLLDAPRRSELGQRAANLVRSRYVPEAIAPALWQDIAARAGRMQAPPSLPLTQIYAGWLTKEMPEPDYVQETLKREALRENVRQLVRQGRSQDAARTLVRAISAITGTVDVRILVESLTALGGDLLPLDMVRGESLLAQAERFIAGLPPGSDLARAHQQDLAKARCPVACEREFHVA